jgi:hypothetical protein
MFDYDFLKFNFSILTRDFLKTEDNISVIILMFIFLEYSLNTAKIVANYNKREYVNSNDYKMGLKFQAMNFHFVKSKILEIFELWKYNITKNDSYTLLETLNDNVRKLINFIEKDINNENEIVLSLGTYPPQINEENISVHENPENILSQVKNWDAWNPINHQSIILKCIVFHLIS